MLLKGFGFSLQNYRLQILLFQIRQFADFSFILIQENSTLWPMDKCTQSASFDHIEWTKYFEFVFLVVQSITFEKCGSHFSNIIFPVTEHISVSILYGFDDTYLAY